MKNSNMSSVGEALREAIRRYGLERNIREQEVITRWDDIVGPAISRRARPERIDKGTLVVRVQEPAWRQELYLRRAELMDMINAAAGRPIVSGIVFR